MEENGKLKLNQYRFLLNGKKQNVQWKIPLTARYTGGTRSVLFDSESMEMDSSGFIKLNDSETGFYRVLYSSPLYENIIKNISILDNKDIFGLLNDMHAFLVSGKITFVEYLTMIEKFMELNDPFIIREISNELFSLYLIDPKNSLVLGTSCIFVFEILQVKVKTFTEYLVGDEGIDHSEYASAPAYFPYIYFFKFFSYFVHMVKAYKWNYRFYYLGGVSRSG